MGEQKVSRGNSSQFFVAGELCRRGYSAVVTLGSTPNTDILCSNLEGTRFVHIQVKTFRPGDVTCSVGQKAEMVYSDDFFWVLAGIPVIGSTADFEYFIIPASVMSVNVRSKHQDWLHTKGAKGQDRNDTKLRTVILPPYKRQDGWHVEGQYRNKWELIEKVLDN